MGAAYVGGDALPGLRSKSQERHEVRLPRQMIEHSAEQYGRGVLEPALDGTKVDLGAIGQLAQCAGGQRGRGASASSSE